MVALARMFQSDRPATYCKVNVVVPILRLWLDVELDTKPDFRLSRQAMHSLQRTTETCWNLMVMQQTSWTRNFLSMKLLRNMKGQGLQ
uniref:Uncharacterized protein n=1 Tax=Knipowitschia caucasica TaxID=637954 RepID=A0AAV2KS93_KNICA